MSDHPTGDDYTPPPSPWAKKSAEPPQSPADHPADHPVDPGQMTTTEGDAEPGQAADSDPDSTSAAGAQGAKVRESAADDYDYDYGHDQPAGGSAEAGSAEVPGDGWFDVDGGADQPLRPVGRQSSQRLSAVLMVVLSLGLVACAAWAVMIYQGRQQLHGALEGALNLMGEGAPPDLAQRFETLRGDLDAGHYGQVSEAIGDLHQLLRQSGEPTGGPGLAGPLPPDAYNDLPEDAATFFRAHEDLFRRFLLLCDRARQLRDQGHDVDELRQARDAVIEAARLGQSERVQQRILAMAQLFPGGDEGGEGGPDDAQRAKLQNQARAFREAAEKAQRQGRDLRAAMNLMQQAEKAAQAGEFGRAAELLSQATEATKRAPRMAGGDLRRSRPWGRPTGPGAAAQPQLTLLVRSLLGLLSVEDHDLGFVWEAMTDVHHDLTTPAAPPQTGEGAGDAVDNETPGADSDNNEAGDPLAGVLARVEAALARLQGVSERRRELSVQLGLSKPAVAPPSNKNQPPQATQPQLPPTRQQVVAIVRERLWPILERIRTLSADEFNQQKEQLITAIMRAVLEPPAPKPATPTPPPLTLPADPADQVREKLRLAAPTLRQWQTEGRDTTEIDQLFSQARSELYAGSVDEAAKLVDEALQKLGRSDHAAPSPSATTTRPEPSGSSLSDPEASKLRLRP